MSLATKYASYFTPVVGNMIQTEYLAKGLATTFHEKVQQVVTELFEGRSFDGKEAAELHLQVCVEIEKEMIKEVEKYYGSGVSLTEAVSAWKGYKSIYKVGMLLGINPLDHASYRQFKEAKLALGKGAETKTEVKTESSGNTDTSDSGGDTSNTVTIAPVSNGLSDKVNARLALAMEVLTELAQADEAEALTVLANMEGACRSKLRKGNRMMALK